MQAVRDVHQGLGGEVRRRAATEAGEGDTPERRDTRNAVGISAAPDSDEHCRRYVRRHEVAEIKEGKSRNNRKQTGKLE